MNPVSCLRHRLRRSKVSRKDVAETRAHTCHSVSIGSFAQVFCTNIFTEITSLLLCTHRRRYIRGWNKYKVVIPSARQHHATSDYKSIKTMIDIWKTTQRNGYGYRRGDGLRYSLTTRALATVTTITLRKHRRRWKPEPCWCAHKSNIQSVILSYPLFSLLTQSFPGRNPPQTTDGIVQ